MNSFFVATELELNDARTFGTFNFDAFGDTFVGAVDLLTCEGSGMTTYDETPDPEVNSGRWDNGELTWDFPAESVLSQVFWTPEDATGTGDFSQDTNWEPQLVPTNTVVTFFDRDGSATVRFSGTQESARTVVERGEVTFSEGHHNVVADDAQPGVVVGNATMDVATLILSSHLLTSASGAIGYGVDTIGNVNVSGSGTDWLMSGPLTVGDRGSGTLILDQEGRVTCSEFVLGKTAASSAIVQMSEGSSLETGMLSVGVAAESSIVVDESSLTSALGVIGLEGMGSVTVSGNGGKWLVNEGLTIGQGSEGLLEVSDGAEVIVASGDVGVGEFAMGTLTVRPGGSFNVGGGDLYVGGAAQKPVSSCLGPVLKDLVHQPFRCLANSSYRAEGIRASILMVALLSARKRLP